MLHGAGVDRKEGAAFVEGRSGAYEAHASSRAARGHLAHGAGVCTRPTVVYLYTRALALLPTRLSRP